MRWRRQGGNVLDIRHVFLSQTVCKVDIIHEINGPMDRDLLTTPLMVSINTFASRASLAHACIYIHTELQQNYHADDHAGNRIKQLKVQITI